MRSCYRFSSPSLCRPAQRNCRLSHSIRAYSVAQRFAHVNFTHAPTEQLPLWHSTMFVKHMGVTQSIGHVGVAGLPLRTEAVAYRSHQVMVRAATALF